MQNAKCKMQNECNFFAETKKLLNGIHRYLYNQKLIVPYGETSFSSKSIPSHSIELRFAKAKRLINFAFCILHFAFCISGSARQTQIYPFTIIRRRFTGLVCADRGKIPVEKPA